MVTAVVERPRDGVRVTDNAGIRKLCIAIIEVAARDLSVMDRRIRVDQETHSRSEHAQEFFKDRGSGIFPLFCRAYQGDRPSIAEKVFADAKEAGRKNSIRSRPLYQFLERNLLASPTNAVAELPPPGHPPQHRDRSRDGQSRDRSWSVMDAVLLTN